MKEKKYSFSNASKEPMKTVVPFKNDNVSLQRCSDYMDDEAPHTKLSERHSKRSPSKWKNVKRYSSSSNSSKEIYDTRSEKESEENER